MHSKRYNPALFFILTMSFALCIPPTSETFADNHAAPQADSDRSTPLQVGDSLPEKLVLHTADGSAFDLQKSISESPSILIFYRGGW